VKLACPDAFVVPDTVVTVDEPPPCPSETDWPLSGCPKASFAVTVTVEVVEPSAVTEPGAAETVDAVASTAPAVNDTVAVCVTVTESVLSVAVYVVDSTAASTTVNVAWPEPFVVAETVVIVEEPPLFARVTVFPLTGFERVSFNVTVIVDAVEPSAVTDAGEAETVDWAALTAPLVNVTDAVCVTVTESVLSVAV
jgi:hypothetical protein